MDKEQFAWYLTGLTDGEGSFYLGVHHYKNSKSRPCLRTWFVINMNDIELPLIEKIKDYFQCGIITFHKPYKKSRRSVEFRVAKISDIINKIIPHFDRYPLIASKLQNYLIWKEIAYELNNKTHHSEEGWIKIVKMRENLNKNTKKNRKN